MNDEPRRNAVTRELAAELARRRARRRRIQLTALVIALVIIIGLVAVALARVMHDQIRVAAENSTPTAAVAPGTTTRAAVVTVLPPKAPRTAPAKTLAPSPKTSRASTTLPEEMTWQLAGSQQVIVITGARIGSTTGTLALYNQGGGRWTKVLSTPANFGKGGLVDGDARTSGHLQTPTGIWFVSDFLFGQHATPPPGTLMPYRHITNSSYWSSAHGSTYNTWVDTSVPGEHLADSVVQYEYAFDTGYNSPPNETVYGRGTAIFIHCFEPAGNTLGQFTHGCIAIDRTVMVKLFTLLDPARHPSCAIGTLQKGTPASIYSY